MKNEKKIRIALLGVGTVGSALVKLLRENADYLKEKRGAEVEIRKVLDRNPEKLAKVGLAESLFTNDIDEILADDSIDTVVELLGRIEPAHVYLQKALKAGKNVVTANKDLLCLYGEELEKLAAKHNVKLLYEASCLGTIPVINTLNNCFYGDRISELVGICNGTSNYILTKMTEENLGFDEALKQAQEAGYAESDPTNDIEGIDCVYKLCILARLAYGAKVEFGDVARTGIREITAKDISSAKRFDFVIKLLSSCRLNNGKLELRVNPVLVPKEHILSKINNSLNAIVIRGDRCGSVTLTGAGAGGDPTASAVANDILHVADGEPALQLHLKQLPFEKDYELSYYVRMTVKDEAGVLSSVAQCFAKHGISLALVDQQAASDKDCKKIVLITHPTKVSAMDETLRSLHESKNFVRVKAVMEVLQP